MSSTEKREMTQQEYNELLTERDHLMNVVLKEIFSELRKARTQGDLSQNPTYDALRTRLTQVEERINELEEQIKQAITIEVDPSQMS